jgi:hypothetical protein
MEARVVELSPEQMSQEDIAAYFSIAWLAFA